MPIFVSDASVILKWALPLDHELFADRALALRNSLIYGTITLAVPGLWYFEVGNTLARKYPETAPEQLRLLRRIGRTEYAQARAASGGAAVGGPACGAECRGSARLLPRLRSNPRDGRPRIPTGQGRSGGFAGTSMGRCSGAWTN